ncbi:MAG TPA: type II toxin-antitoxin system VapC family toxin [Acidobacteriaceae bacterium]|nr:type II toxin-antitoxin system VapC family toxin [Acidobacteriaceae bacterium]
MRLLLDTHALLWWVLDAKELSRKARRAIHDFNNEVFVSAATSWEIATKFRMGRLPEAESFVYSFRENLQKLGFSELYISVEHAQRAGLLPGEHKDPFDRMLLAQAQAEGLVLVSNEKVFDSYPISRLW